jgi:hypothetical protein
VRCIDPFSFVATQLGAREVPNLSEIDDADDVRFAWLIARPSITAPVRPHLRNSTKSWAPRTLIDADAIKRLNEATA